MSNTAVSGQLKDEEMNAKSALAGCLNRLPKSLFSGFPLVLMFICACQCAAQIPAHKFHDSNQLPGAVAYDQLMRRPQMNGYVQPFRFILPGNAEVSVYKNGGFEKVESDASIGLMVGRVYRLKVTNIPQHPGTIVYPSLEIINRLYPPQGEADKHAVEVLLDLDDFVQVDKGNVITRVVYLENPKIALPVTQRAGEQQWYDTAPGEDPLKTAQLNGRPMAIVRIGSRVPDPSDGVAFHFGQPLVTHAAQAGCSSCCGCAACTPEDPRMGADEFVCDGGDRDLKVVLQEGDEVAGLDSEDTIGHFSTSDGKLLISESNRVCIYSPRFGAVRTNSQAISTHGLQSMARFHDRTEPKDFVEMENAEFTNQNIRVQQNRATKAATQFRDQTRGLAVDNTTHLRSFDNDFGLHESFQIMRIGKMRSDEGAKLIRAMQAARAWEDNLALQVVSETASIAVTRDVQIVEVATHIERPDNRPHLRIIKTASKSSARPGETVEFTIRFDNVGDQTIEDIAIMDNLTTRLKFVEGSAQCSVPAEFTSNSNTSFSHTLKWTIDGPLEVNEGGIIRFQCIVR